MVQKACVICGTHFEAVKSAVACSEECRHENKKRTTKAWYCADRNAPYYIFRSCVECGKMFKVRGNIYTCSPACGKTLRVKKETRCRKRWRERHPEKEREIQRTHYRNNKAKIAARIKEYQKKNPEKFKAYAANYYARNRENIALRVKQRREENPQRFREWSSRGRFKERLARIMLETNLATYNMEKSQ